MIGNLVLNLSKKDIKEIIKEYIKQTTNVSLTDADIILTHDTYSVNGKIFLPKDVIEKKQSTPPSTPTIDI